MYLHICVQVRMCVSLGTHGGQNRAQDTELLLTWVLGTELGAYTRTDSSLNLRTGTR